MGCRGGAGGVRGGICSLLRPALSPPARATAAFPQQCVLWIAQRLFPELRGYHLQQNSVSESCARLGCLESKYCADLPEKPETLVLLEASRCPTAPARSNTANTFDWSRFFGKTNTCRYWLTQKDFYRVKAAPDESRDIITSARSILDRENYFVREVDSYLRHHDFLNLRKKEILYKKWLEDVSEPLLWKIEDKMGSQSREEIQKRREEQLSLYLNYCKKKGYVTLEAYDPSEYDPLFLKTCTDCWKVSIPALQDPLLKAVQKKFIETGIVKRCETGRRCSTRELQELPLLPLGRQRMDAIEWLKVPHTYIASELHRTRRLRVVDHHKNSESR